MCRDQNCRACQYASSGAAGISLKTCQRIESSTSQTLAPNTKRRFMLNLLKNSRGRAVLLRLLCVLCLSSPALSAGGAPPKVTTVAGGYLGNGKTATSAAFANPVSVARDRKGNLFISGSISCQIRKVNPKGVVSRFAGTGICGFSGDGGPAKSAQLGNTQQIAFDGRGNLLIADASSSRIRKITPTGVISTIAGNGTVGYSGDGGAATEASLAYPFGVAIDSSGRIYIADSSNYVIRLVDSAGIIHTVAGNHTSGFSGDGGPATSAQIQDPNRVIADDNGNFYIADSRNYRVRKVDANGIITTYAGNGTYGTSGNGGPATEASLGNCNGLSLGGGKLYIATGGNIWAVDQSTQIINLVAGSDTGDSGFRGDGGPALSALFAPSDVSFETTGQLLIADAGNSRIRSIDSNQIVSTVAGGYLGDDGPARRAYLSGTMSGGHIVFDAAGNLYFADTFNHRIRKISPSGIITTIAGTGITGYAGDGGPATAATLNFPQSVVIDGNGNLFIGDTNNGSIRKVDSTGTITTFVQTVSVPAPWGGDVLISVSPRGMAIDAANNLYVASQNNCFILKVAPDATASVVAGMLWQCGYNGDGIPATQAYVGVPTAVTLDRAGNLYIADWLNNRVRKVDTNGMMWTAAGNGNGGFSGDGGPATDATLSLPMDVAVDVKGNLYIGDTINARLRVVDSTGTIRTFAGNGHWDFNGDGLPATQSTVVPNAVALNAKGIAYLMDWGSYRLRRVR